MSTLAEDKLVLRLVERSDFSQIGVNPRSLPESIPQGRAFSSSGGREIQIAVVEPQLSAPEQTEYIRRLGVKYTERDAQLPRGSLPFSIAEMPTSFTFHPPTHANAEAAPGELFLGLGGDDVKPITINPLAVPTFVVAGPSGSGRSNALLHLSRRALERGFHLVVLAPLNSAVTSLEQLNGVKAVISGTSITQADLEPHFTNITCPTLLVADDAEMLREISAAAWLKDVIPRARDRRIGFLLAGKPREMDQGFTGWLKQALQSCRGVILAPQEASQGSAVNLSITRHHVNAATSFPQGRGYTLGDASEIVTVQIPKQI
jgi:S-DNA-T family DNA segregation ATPase FtsK/SpoIIIE